MTAPVDGAARAGDEDAGRTISVMVVDDRRAARMGLTPMVNRADDLRVIAWATNGRNALDQLDGLAERREHLLDVGKGSDDSTTPLLPSSGPGEADPSSTSGPGLGSQSAPGSAKRRAAATTAARRPACSSSEGGPQSIRATWGTVDHQPAMDSTSIIRCGASMLAVTVPASWPSTTASDLHS